jgi:RNA polymerase sigma-70 factor (family 1)
MSKAVMQKGFMQRFNQGDPDAIRDIFQEFYRSLCYFANQLIHNQQEAEDIAIDSIIKLLEKRGDFDNILNIRSFLFVSTRNSCFDFLRSEQRHGNSHKELLYLQGEAEEQVENEMIKARVLQEIYTKVEVLPPQCRKVFKLIFFEGLSTSQIAQRMNITARTVLNQKARAIQLLRGTLINKDMLPTVGVALLFLSL